MGLGRLSMMSMFQKLPLIPHCFPGCLAFGIPNSIVILFFERLALDV
jgi:hypothetical protein